MQAAALKTAIALLAVAAASALIGSTVSAFSKTTGNGGSTFSTASSFFTCPNQTVSNGFTSGLETGRRAYSGDGLFPNGTGVSVDSAMARTGGYSLKVAASGAAGYGGWFWLTSPTSTVVRFALRMDTLPTADVQQLFGITTLGGGLVSLRWVAASQKLALAIKSTSAGTPVVATASSTLSAGVWHVIEVRHSVGSTTHSADWRIDTVAQTSASVAGTASTSSQTYFGTQVADTFTAYYDDVLISSSSAQYPLGDGRVYPLTVDGVGTHSGAANFQDDDATALDATSWQRLDEIPTNSIADYIQQTVASGTSYAEFTFSDTTETCIRAVHAMFAVHSAATNQANAAKVSVFDGSTESVLKSGTLAANVAGSRDYGRPVAPASSPWTKAALNGLVVRFGYATDVAPVPMFDGAILEYEVPQ